MARNGSGAMSAVRSLSEKKRTSPGWSNLVEIDPGCVKTRHLTSSGESDPQKQPRRSSVCSLHALSGCPEKCFSPRSPGGRVFTRPRPEPDIGHLSKYTAFDRPDCLPSVEFVQLHCGIVILGHAHATTRVRHAYRWCCSGLVGNRACAAAGTNAADRNLHPSWP